MGCELRSSSQRLESLKELSQTLGPVPILCSDHFLPSQLQGNHLGVWDTAAVVAHVHKSCRVQGQWGLVTQTLRTWGQMCLCYSCHPG